MAKQKERQVPSPKPWRANYIHVRTLNAQIRASIARGLQGQTGLAVLDVGCGARPYEPHFERMAAEYTGVDSVNGPRVDVVSRAEELPFPANSFDCVICTQVLHLVDDPLAVTSEVARVLRAGGLALFSTHGVAHYHPPPEDHWRWTHTGLQRLLRQTGDWASVDVWFNGGTASALAYLIGSALETICNQARLGFLPAPAVYLMNLMAWHLDRLYLQLFPGRPPDLASNYLAVAVKA